ncbi:MAG TPA: AsmA-like C-terminal region-containing protein [Candidatus Saccharimonadales bacterium]|nr:AsmA-like C-terminal region-containing protein [Candidatus Saccharimonadales bacterium]
MRRIETRVTVSSRWKLGLWIAGGTILAIVGMLIIVCVVILRSARGWVEGSLTHEFNSKVELSSFRVAVPFPLVQGEGENLALHFQGRQDLPPLIFVKRFTLRASIWGLLHNSRRISFVHVEGLQINVPPRGDSTGGGINAKSAMRKFRALRFDEILSDDATLKILTSRPGKKPLEFDLKQLRLNSTGTDGALAFQTTLSNPTPPGEIVSAGIFGPWNADVPSETPVSGNYTFENADLGIFSGIAGILSSKGNYQGVLDQIQVDGTTDTSDFRVTLAGHPVDLSTIFHAVVDGMNGDTYLQPVKVHFGQTDLLAQGKVEGTAGKKGKTITLDVSATHARIEDLLLLAVKESPPMTAPIRLKTKFILVPGPQQIPERLFLEGSFDLDSLHFTNSATQQKVDNMSKRSMGKPNEVVNVEEAIKSDDVTSKLKGNFRAENGILTLSGIDYGLPGADVQLAGTYGLDPETLDLRGKLTMQAKLSQTTTGFKSFLLKFADPVFSKGAKGTVVPIKITGPVQHPHYGLNLGH